jgi:hypothetical protein
LLTFHRNRTATDPTPMRIVNQSPMAIRPRRTLAPRMVPIAAAYAPLTNPWTKSVLESSNISAGYVVLSAYFNPPEIDPRVQLRPLRQSLRPRLTIDPFASLQARP